MVRGGGGELHPAALRIFLKKIIKNCGARQTEALQWRGTDKVRQVYTKCSVNRLFKRTTLKQPQDSDHIAGETQGGYTVDGKAYRP